MSNFLTCCSSMCVCVPMTLNRCCAFLLIQWNSRERNLFSNTLLSLFTFFQYFCIKQHPLLGLQLIFLYSSKFCWCNASMLYGCRNKKSDYYQNVEEIFIMRQRKMSYSPLCFRTTFFHRKIENTQNWFNSNKISI